MRFLVPILFAGSLAAATHVVTVAGLGGEPDYEQRFSAWANEHEKLLKGSGGELHVETLSGALATKAGIRSTIERIAKEAKPDDALVVVLIGHGTFDGIEYKANIPGPDITAVELAALLDRVPVKSQLVVNTTSASGGSATALQKPSRTVVTATKSGTEKNATVFARYWIEALRDPAADTDKNEVVNALEAFQYAELKTKQFYESNKRLATEHPMLDGGDEQGHLAAARFTLIRHGAAQMAARDPAKQELFAKRERLEAEIDQLKFQKAAMPTEEYKKKLTELLLELARTQEELDK
jgi:hypothetical protein